MNTRELVAALKVDASTIAKFRDSGMPCTRKGRGFVYEETEVTEWLLKTGRAKRKHATVVLNSSAELAAHFRCSRREIQDWVKMPGFPGVPGRPGLPKGTGYFPVAEIEEWLKAGKPQNGFAGDGDTTVQTSIMSERMRLTQVRADRATLELSRDKGEVVDREYVERDMAETIAILKERAAQVPGRIVVRLPSTLSSKDKAAVRDEVKSAFDDMFIELAERQVRLARNYDDEN